MVGESESNVALLNEDVDVVQLIGFQIGTKLFGATILTVREILRNPVVEQKNSGAPDFVRGLIRLRGVYLPLVSLGGILGVDGRRGLDDRPWVLIGLAGRRRVGFLVDGVIPIVRMRADAILPPPEMLLSGLRSKYIRGVCETDKGMMMIVALDRIFRDDEVSVLESIPVK